MSKEMTPLEAFHKIIDMAHEPNGYQNFTNACDTPYTTIVETALKEHERMTYLCNGCVQHSQTYYMEKKALEIIKEKSVDVGFLQYCSSVETYNNYITEHAWTKHTKRLTQEEYELLKEVLL